MPGGSPVAVRWGKIADADELERAFEEEERLMRAANVPPRAHIAPGSPSPGSPSPCLPWRTRPLATIPRRAGMPRTGSFDDLPRGERQYDVESRYLGDGTEAKTSQESLCSCTPSCSSCELLLACCGPDTSDAGAGVEMSTRAHALDVDVDKALPRTGSYDDLTRGRRQVDLKSAFLPRSAALRHAAAGHASPMLSQRPASAATAGLGLNRRSCSATQLGELLSPPRTLRGTPSTLKRSSSFEMLRRGRHSALCGRAQTPCALRHHASERGGERQRHDVPATEGGSAGREDAFFVRAQRSSAQGRSEAEVEIAALLLRA